MTSTTLELVLIGFGVGALAGLTGVGGASIMAPLLVVVMRINPLMAVGCDLLMSVPTRIYSAYIHAKQGTIDPAFVKALCLGGVPGALIGLAILSWLRIHVPLASIEASVRHAIGIVLVIAAALLIVSSVRAKGAAVSGAERPNVSGPKRRADWLKLVAMGALVGFIVSITSIGSGSVTLPLLAMLFPLVPISKLIGSDIAFAAILVTVAAAGHWPLKDIDLGIVAALLIGALPGVYVGTKLSGALHERWLRPTVAVVLLVVGSRLGLA